MILVGSFGQNLLFLIRFGVRSCRQRRRIKEEGQVARPTKSGSQFCLSKYWQQ